MSSSPASSTVLVTGINGYIGSHVADVLLSRGFKVRGTLRDPAKAKNLEARWKAAGYAGKYEFAIVADLETENGFVDAVRGVELIAHVASPVTFAASDPYKDVINPAVNGTLSLLRAASHEPSVKRVVITSSFVSMIKQVAPGYKYSEEDWNDWASAVVAQQGAAASGLVTYLASKTEAERAAWKFVEENKPGFTVSTINPVYVFGPPINSPTTADGAGLTVQMIYSLIDGSKATFDEPSQFNAFVDVRDVAKAHVEALLRPEASGRYLLSAREFNWPEVAQVIREAFPNRTIPAPNPAPEVVSDVVRGTKATRDLGIEYRSLRETIKDTLDSMIATVEA